MNRNNFSAYRKIILCQNHCFALFLDAFRRRSFFLRHFQRWFPCFFQAREPRFMQPADLLPLYERFVL
jgi:hypothetical protein